MERQWAEKDMRASDPTAPCRQMASQLGPEHDPVVSLHMCTTGCLERLLKAPTSGCLISTTLRPVRNKCQHAYPAPPSLTLRTPRSRPAPSCPTLPCPVCPALPSLAPSHLEHPSQPPCHALACPSPAPPHLENTSQPSLHCPHLGPRPLQLLTRTLPNLHSDPAAGVHNQCSGFNSKDTGQQSALLACTLPRLQPTTTKQQHDSTRAHGSAPRDLPTSPPHRRTLTAAAAACPKGQCLPRPPAQYRCCSGLSIGIMPALPHPTSKAPSVLTEPSSSRADPISPARWGSVATFCVAGRQLGSFFQYSALLLHSRKLHYRMLAVL